MKIIKLIAAVLTSSTLMAQVVRFDGNFTQINNSAVNGAYVGFFDSSKKTLSMAGITDSVGVKLSYSEKDASIPANTTPVTSGVLYGSDDFKFFNIQHTKTQNEVFKLSVAIYAVYVGIVNDISIFNFVANGIDAGKNYTIIINNGAEPVAYATFTPVPEPEMAVFAASLGLIGFGLFRVNQTKQRY